MDDRAKSKMSPNFFSLPDLDRASGRRTDEAWVSSRLAGPDTLILPVWQERNLSSKRSDLSPVLIPGPEAADVLRGAESIVLLGQLHERLHFSVGLPPGDGTPPMWAAKYGVFRDLLHVAPVIGHAEGALLAYARAMAYWHRRHRYCGDCGAPTVSADAGHLLVCSNPACVEQHFPRIDPAVITVVTFGDRCLFGRKHEWPGGMYSIIAGFVEPGESLEAAVSREVFEETGVRVGNIVYRSSQPWPFPSSLMLGFSASATSTEISLGDLELEDARWMSRSEIVDGLRSGPFRLPSPTSISLSLITEWFDAGDPGRLASVVESVGSAQTA